MRIRAAVVLFGGFDDQGSNICTQWAKTPRETQFREATLYLRTAASYLHTELQIKHYFQNFLDNEFFPAPKEPTSTYNK